MTTRAEALAHFGLAKSDYNRDTLIQELDLTDEEAIAHFGVPGMKWGVIRNKIGSGLQARSDARSRLKSDHPDYSKELRRKDRVKFGERSTDRINRRMNEGMDHRAAVQKEQRRKEIQRKIILGSTAAAVILAHIGPALYSDFRDTTQTRAATNRDKRAQAKEDFIREGPKKPDTKNVKKNFRGVYNVTTI